MKAPTSEVFGILSISLSWRPGKLVTLLFTFAIPINLGRIIVVNRFLAVINVEFSSSACEVFLVYNKVLVCTNALS